MSEPMPQISVDEQAAYWFLRLRDHDVSAEEIEAALDWQDERPEHHAAFARAEALWRLSDELGVLPLPDPFDERSQLVASDRGVGRIDTPRSPSFAIGRRFALAARPLLAASVAALLILAVIQGVPFFKPRPPELVRYATAIGENRVVKLADNSEIVLGGASAISVDYSRKLRHVSLTDGEALFKVAKDHSRPFIVAAAGGQVQAIGTQFDVRRGLEGVTVTVIEGTVQVQPIVTGSNAQPPVAARLGAGHQVSYSSDGEIGAIVRTAAEQSLAWRDGKLIFINRSLADIVIDLNRYSPKLITIDDADVRSLRFTGVIVVADVGDWLRALEKSLPVRVIEEEQKLSLVGAAQRPAS